MYVAVKGGDAAIENSQTLLEEERRGDRRVPELTLDQIKNQLSLSVTGSWLKGPFTTEILRH